MRDDLPKYGLGSVELLGQFATDLSVVNAARVSFAKQKDVMDLGDEKLISFLLREHHGTPFEHGYFQFRIEAPIFVFREWHRHRVGHSYNEMSARYVELPKHFYLPKAFRRQEGKPGNYTYVDMVPRTPLQKLRTRYLLWLMTSSYKKSWRSYKSMIAQGIAKEQARAVLPMGIMSQMIWSCNPRSLMHFIGLRNNPKAQREIKDLAAEAEMALQMTMPVTYSAFIKHGRVAP